MVVPTKGESEADGSGTPASSCFNNATYRVTLESPQCPLFIKLP